MAPHESGLVVKEYFETAPAESLEKVGPTRDNNNL
jgi:hypothetical protein